MDSIAIYKNSGKGELGNRGRAMCECVGKGMKGHRCWDMHMGS